MAIYEDLFDELQAHAPQSRLQIAHDKQALLEELTPYELDRIALLLLAASDTEMKDEYPVDGESRVRRAKDITYGAFA